MNYDELGALRSVHSGYAPLRGRQRSHSVAAVPTSFATDALALAWTASQPLADVPTGARHTRAVSFGSAVDAGLSVPMPALGMMSGMGMMPNMGINMGMMPASESPAAWSAGEWEPKPQREMPFLHTPPSSAQGVPAGDPTNIFATARSLAQVLGSLQPSSATSPAAPVARRGSFSAVSVASSGGVCRRRRRASFAQLSVLNAAYDMCKMPDQLTRQWLSRQCGMTQRSVTIWFQNRRAKERLERNKARAAAAASTASTANDAPRSPVSPLSASLQSEALPDNISDPVSSQDAAFSALLGSLGPDPDEDLFPLPNPTWSTTPEPASLDESLWSPEPSDDIDNWPMSLKTDIVSSEKSSDPFSCGAGSVDSNAARLLGTTRAPVL